METKFSLELDRRCVRRAASHSRHRAARISLHIENYLLDSRFIAEAVAELTLEDTAPQSVESDILNAARLQLEELAFRNVRVALNRELVGGIDLGKGRGDEDASETLYTRLRASGQRFNTALEGFSKTSINDRMEQERQRLRAALDDGTWNKIFPGRDILKAFSKARLRGTVTYEALRNLVVVKMVASGHQPGGMRQVLESIEPAAFDTAALEN